MLPRLLGVPIYALKEWLGHATIEMTERYISEVTEALEIVKRSSAEVVELKKKRFETCTRSAPAKNSH